eukprot:COSAG01_NODE_3812_length_5675_cov_2.804878_7_plen_167_part_00
MVEVDILLCTKGGLKQLKLLTTKDGREQCLQLLKPTQQTISSTPQDDADHNETTPLLQPLEIDENEAQLHATVQLIQSELDRLTTQFTKLGVEVALDPDINAVFSSVEKQLRDAMNLNPTGHKGPQRSQRLWNEEVQRIRNKHVTKLQKVLSDKLAQKKKRFQNSE